MIVEANEKFSKCWVSNLEQYRVWERELTERGHVLISTDVHDKEKTRSRSTPMIGFHQVKEGMGKDSLKKPVLVKFCFHGNHERGVDHFSTSKQGYQVFCRTRGTMQNTSTDSSQRTSISSGKILKQLGISRSTPTIHRVRGVEIQKSASLRNQ